jgi:HEAT repeats
MPERRGAGRRVAGILGCVAIVTVAIVGIRWGFFGAKRGGGSGSAGSASGAFDEKTPLADLSAAARNSDPSVLAEILRRLADSKDMPALAFTEEEATAWLQVLECLRTGFLGYKRSARVLSLQAAAGIFGRFGVEPASGQWVSALKPMHDLLAASLGDADPDLRKGALDELGKLWVWLPGRSMTPAEETKLVEWKEGIYMPVVRCLGHRDSTTLRAAIRCLGKLPVDDAGRPAMAYLDNPDPKVRQETLEAFAMRPMLLTEDMLLTRLEDQDPTIRDTARKVLKDDRRLSEDQINLGRLIFSSKPQQRMSLIPMLKDRNDVDPAVWLIQLSRDSVEMVRLSAVEAMAGLQSPSVRKRLAEMARSDASEAVRKAAGKVVPAPPSPQNTASLPALPSSTNLNPRAN